MISNAHPCAYRGRRRNLTLISIMSASIHGPHINEPWQEVAVCVALSIFQKLINAFFFNLIPFSLSFLFFIKKGEILWKMKDHVWALEYWTVWGRESPLWPEDEKCSFPYLITTHVVAWNVITVIRMEPSTLLIGLTCF